MKNGESPGFFQVLPIALTLATFMERRHPVAIAETPRRQAPYHAHVWECTMRMVEGLPCAWSRGYHAHVRGRTMRMSGGVPCAWSRGYHAHDHGEFWLAYGSDVWYNERKKRFGKEVYVFLDNLISKVSTCVTNVLCTSVPGVFLACACSSPNVTVDVKDTTPPKPRGDELSEALFDNLRAYCRSSRLAAPKARRSRSRSRRSSWNKRHPHHNASPLQPVCRGLVSFSQS